VLVLLLCAAMAVCRAFPETQIAKHLRRILIEAPASALSGISPARWVFFLCLLLACAAFFAYAKTEGLFIAGQFAGDGMVWFLAFDVGTYIDAIAIIAVIAANVRVRAIREAARLVIARARSWLSRGASGTQNHRRPNPGRRAHRIRRPGPRRPANDDDGWPIPAAA
jgi:hypothetical protein